jgi:hypothetical protein
MGLEDNKARVHIELSKDPISIEEAVQEVIAYIEATSYPPYHKCALILLRTFLGFPRLSGFYD